MSTVSKVSTFVRIILNPLLNSLTNVTFQLPDINQYLEMEMVVTWTLDTALSVCLHDGVQQKVVIRATTFFRRQITQEFLKPCIKFWKKYLIWTEMRKLCKCE